MTPFPSCDTTAGINIATWTKESCCSSFWSSWAKECNGATDDPWASCNGGT